MRNVIFAWLPSIVLSALLNFVATESASASQNWQYRDGIFGEIKYARACNTGAVVRYRVNAEAGSGDPSVRNRVNSVEFKEFSAYAIGFNLWGQTFGFPSSPAWKNVSKIGNYWSGDRRFYTVDLAFPLTTYIQNTPIKFSIHVNHSGGKTIDLGGIVNLDDIPAGHCKTYDDGAFYNY